MDDGTMPYRVTDVVLHSAEDLTALAAALKTRGMTATQRALEIDETDRMWVFQVGCEQLPEDNPQAELALFLAAVESLDPPERAAWSGCSRREFDMAFDCGIQPHSVHHDLSSAMLARLAGVGWSMRITLYPFDPRDMPPNEAVAE